MRKNPSPRHSEGTLLSRRLAEKIAKIQDPVERNRVARETCLQLIVRFPHLREHVFLRQCRVPDCEGGLGPKLRVKKTKYAVRIQHDDHKPWGDVSRTKERDRLYRQAMGLGSEDYEDLDDDTEGRYHSALKSMNGELVPLYVWQSRMW